MTEKHEFAIKNNEIYIIDTRASKKSSMQYFFFIFLSQ